MSTLERPIAIADTTCEGPSSHLEVTVARIDLTVYRVRRPIAGRPDPPARALGQHRRRGSRNPGPVAIAKNSPEAFPVGVARGAREPRPSNNTS